MELRDYSDEEALHDLARGSEKAFAVIYERYYAAVARQALKYFPDKKLAEDLVQEIFTRVWVNRGEFLEVENLQAYLYVMIKNSALQSIHKISREMIAKEEYARRKPIADNSIEDYLIEKDYRELVDKAVAGLPAPQQKVFMLAKIDNVSRTDIARELQLSQQTVDNYLALAVKTIKHRLKHHIVVAVGVLASAFA